MQKYQNPDPYQPDFWLPVALLLLPVTMMLMPLVVNVDPNRALFYIPLLVQVLLVVIVFYAALTGASRGRAGAVGKIWAVAVLMLVVLALYTTVFRAGDIAYSIDKLVDFGLIAALAYFVKNLFERSGKQLIDRSLRAIFCSVVLAVPVMALMFYYRVPEHDLWPNFVPGFAHIRIYGFSLTIAIAIGTGLLALPQNQTIRFRLLILAGLLLLWTALFWSGSRGGIAAFILVLPIMFLLFPKARKAILLSMLPLVIGAVLSTQFSTQSEAFGVFNSFKDTFEMDSVDKISSGRIHEWRFALDTIANKPVFGHGFGQRLLLGGEDVRKQVHVHNIVLEVALAWGWLGATIAGVLIVSAWVAALKKIRKIKRPEYVPAFFVINVLLVYAWVDGVYMYYQATIPFAICVAVLWARFDPDEQKA